MPGYDDEFLGLPAPAPTATVPTVQLDYLHLSVAFRPDRRLAAVTAVNIHGGLLIEIERTRDVWLLDPRIPAIEQAGPELYLNNDFDRGHLVRRRDPGWGTQATALTANNDTFHYTNAAPRSCMVSGIQCGRVRASRGPCFLVAGSADHPARSARSRPSRISSSPKANSLP